MEVGLAVVRAEYSWVAITDRSSMEYATMTLCAAWIRTRNQTRELVVATDSRLRFGRQWDCCPKLFSLGRDDAVLCFAGDTHYAYPFLLQVVASVKSYPKAASRAMELGALRGHIIRVLNGMYGLIADRPKSDLSAFPEVSFVLAGWSWRAADFRIWTLRFDPSRRVFVHHTPSRSKVLGNCVFVGDEVPEAKRRLALALNRPASNRAALLDFEPLGVLRDLSRDRSFRTIGGPPQVMKVYPYLNSMPYGIYWPDRATGDVALFGRPFLPYEKTSYMVLDPDTLKTIDHQ